MTLSDREFRDWKAAHPATRSGSERASPIPPAASGPASSAPRCSSSARWSLALLIGISSAIYLSEYSRNSRFIRLIRIAILNLAGVPSIVFGLFGFGLFVIFFGWNVSLLAGWFTLGLMVLPAIITASEESLRAVPQGLREGSLALGASKWQTIRKNVLPYAMPGILTSSILGIARVAGETAPIMFTAAYAMRDEMPWQVQRWTDFFFQGVMALPYHIYVVSSKIPQNEYTERVQYGAAFVFLVLVMLIALTSIVLARTKPGVAYHGKLDRNARIHSPTIRRPESHRAAGTETARRHDRRSSDLDFAYGNHQVLHDVNLQIPPRAVTAFIGPSGCGKTTLLRCLNRMNDLIDGARISRGSIRIEGVDINAPEVDVVDLRRRVGMVFQKSNPFPKSIYDNVAYGLRIAGVTKRSQIDEAVEKSLRAAALWDEVKDRLHVSGYGLSGGQQQRLCIARALAVEPEIVLDGRALFRARSDRDGESGRTDP